MLLKGAVTLIASANETMFSQAGAPPWAGTAGSGDVLAGIVASVLAQHQARAEQSGHHMSASQVAFAVASAAWVHAMAARNAAGLSLSEEPEAKGLTALGTPIVASDIARAIPQAIAWALARI